MQRPTARTAHDPQVVQTTAKLIEYLRDLAQAGKRTVSHYEKYQNVWWLAELPKGVTAPTDQPDGVLLELPYEPRQPPPEPPAQVAGRIDLEQLTNPTVEPCLQESEQQSVEIPAISSGTPPVEFERWLVQWRLWAEAERQALPRRRLYDDLASASHKLSQHDDTLEAVLGVGLLCMDSPRGETIRRHLITVRIEVSVDRATAMIIVKIPDEATVRLEDRQFLNNLDLYAAERVRHLSVELQQRDLHPLSDGAAGILKRWHERALDVPVRFVDAWGRPEPADGVAAIVLAPALIVRSRDTNLLVDCYERILETLDHPDASAPLGLAQLVFDLEKDERIAWRTRSGQRAELLLGDDPLFPLPANAAQRTVLDRLQRDTAVVVQGPPGTGKTHTIANLIAALLARGKRVLVTSAKDQALSVLRDKIPTELRKLCVQFAYQYGRGSEELERTISALSDHVSSTDLQQLPQRIAVVRAQRSDALKRRASLQNEIYDLRESETLRHAVADGFTGTRADIVEAVEAGRESFEWIAPFPDTASQDPPLDPSAALELAELLKEADCDRLRLRHEVLPTVDLPSVDEFSTLAAAAAAEGDEAPTSLGEGLAGLASERVRSIEQLLDEALDALHRLGVSPRAADWNQADWRVRALLETLADRDQALWQNLRQTTRRAVEHHRLLSGLGVRHVEVPHLTPGKAEVMIDAVETLHEFMANGGKHRLIRPKPLRDATRVISDCLVDGRAPATCDQLDALRIHLEAHALATGLEELWSHAGCRATTRPLAGKLSELCDRAADLSSIQAFAAAAQKIKATLRDGRLRHLTNTAAGWDELLDNIAWSVEQAAAKRAINVLETLTANLAPPFDRIGVEAQTLRDTVLNRDVRSYEQGLRALSTAVVRQSEQARCDELLDRLRASHQALAVGIDECPTDPQWANRLAQLSTAWAWGTAAAYCRRFSDPERDQKLMHELEAADDMVGAITAKLAAEEAWLQCLSRMTQEQRQGLQAYKNRVSDRGKGTSKRYGERHRQGMRDAMSLAQGAVPAWIMPLPLVVETIRHQQDCFDVIIVDEASQMRVDSAFLLWLAPHVIVVGDDQQCAPSSVSYGELKPIHDQIDRYLPDVRPAFRDDFAPTANLYTLLQARFPEVVRLSDHYRCMPEIIGWSSKQFYDDRLVPLRQYGADRLDPLKVVVVEDASIVGIEDRMRNEVEAERLVGTLVELLADPRYDGKTFGVIALQSNGQVRVLERLIAERIDAAEVEARKLRVGLPPDFQGDQRDVVMLSMVVADQPKIATSKPQQRRFNVAASRAEDQMWLFTSIPAHRLNPNDLRYSLAAWMNNPILSEPGQADVDKVYPDIQHPAFDSLFEQRVFLRIQEHGYRVIPQVSAGNNKRIDLMVVGTKGRLGVECDGRVWHTTPSQVRADIAREQELRRAGWELWRLREGDFYLDPDKALEPLWRELDKRDITPGVIGPLPSASSSWQPVELLDTEGEDDHGTA